MNHFNLRIRGLSGLPRAANTILVGIALMFSVTLILSGCQKDNAIDYATPTLSVNGDAVVELKPGDAIKVILNIDGDGGAKSIVVKKGGGFLEELPVDPNATTFTYNTQTVPGDVSEGDEINYTFALNNKNDVLSQEAAITVKVALYDEVTVGNKQLYQVTIPDDGIVKSGTVVKLIKGRDYYIPASVVFENGAKLAVEAGVHVYMKASPDDPIGIQVLGEANIEGTASDPVVFTSSGTLTPATPAAPGDWKEFRLEGTGDDSNNGLVKYIRIEYGADRAFRLSDVGAATQIDYVQVFKSSGEGIMITDGNAGLKHIVATDCEGGSYRLGDAYSGSMQFIVSVNSVYFNENDDFTIREEASPILSNVTLLGPGEDVDNTHGLRMRADAKPKVYNAVIAEFPRRGVRAQDNVAVTDLGGTAVLAYSYVFDVDHDAFKDNAAGFAGTFDPVTGERATNPFFNNAGSLRDDGDYELEPIAGISTGDFVPDAETSSDFDPSTLGSFFTNAAYAGAVRNADEDWTKGWVKNPDGSLR